ncbi:MAG: hypothetical protein H6815_00810 [Phycisphaeraceae bacterium]|nr:hypothetical protein [Phycisphaerales bacterium]MCB9858965.1 hypothetical protein [Phycisphaeraceae bacterium]
MDELKDVDSGLYRDAGALPDALRMQVRRRRIVHRLKTGSGVALGVLLMTVVGVFIAQPNASNESINRPLNGAVISIDDPIFDTLDVEAERSPDATVWRASMLLNSDWSMGL